MKITTGLLPTLEATHDSGRAAYRVLFGSDPASNAEYVLYCRTEPEIVKKGFNLMLYSDQPDYNEARDADAREDHGIPEDVIVEDDPPGEEYGLFARRYTWYEVAA